MDRVNVEFCTLLLQVAEAAGLQEELVSKAKQSRSEKKARKAMSKLGKFLRSYFKNYFLVHITEIYAFNIAKIYQ